MKVLRKLYKKLLLWLSNIREIPLEDKYYLSIEDLPVYNWWRLHEHNDFSQLLKRGKVDDRVTEVVNDLQNEFITIFGINEDYAQMLRKQIEIELLKINMQRTGDRFNETLIEILEVELSDLTKNEEDKGINTANIAIEKYMGFKLDTKIVSTFEYYSYIKAIEQATSNGRKR